MVGRDPAEPHRAATPLELLFDLCFVVAVAQLAAQLHHAEAEGHFLDIVPAYMFVFFGIWWAWVNFTWFASAYDTDDVPYRVMTMLKIAGVLVLAAGVPSAFNDFDFRIITAGYVMMRVVMVLQWLRAAQESPATRRSCLRYAVGIAACQVLWLLRLAVPPPWAGILLLVLGLLELSVPIWAEMSGQPTPWHPEHIAERHGLFTIIVLGECVLAATTSVQAAIAQTGPTVTLLLTSAGGLLLVCGLWWSYFKSSPVDVLQESSFASFAWGYGHWLLYAAVAALGAGLQVVAETSQHALPISDVAAALSVAVPVVVYLLVLGIVHRVTDTRPVEYWPIGVAAVLLLGAALAANVVALPLTVLAMGVIVAGVVATYVYRMGYAAH